jgi:site-specific recombinase XerD
MEFFMKTSSEKLKVSFYLKKNVSGKGLCPVMGRIIVGKDMAQFSCKLEADRSLWDVRAGRMKGKSNHARNVNGEIDKINVAINAKFREIMSIRGQATASDVKNAFQGSPLSQETLLKVFREHNEAFEKRVGATRAKGTYRNYQFSCTSLERFIRKKYRVSDLSFKQLDYSFIENYDYFMKIDCGLAPGTAVVRMTHLQKMIKIAVRKRIISHNPFAGFCIERPKPTQRYVPEKEMEKLKKTHLKSSALNVTRDMFLFSCLTGLSYIDLYNLTCRQIEKDDDGYLWVNISRQKTDSESKIFLLDDALRLIEKYKGSGSGEKVFPMKSCSHMNRQLKRIAALCGIQRRLTFHMSRHTFATETCLSQGISIESVSRMMGHNDLKTTEHYAKITPDKMYKDMQALSEIINDMYVLAS